MKIRHYFYGGGKALVFSSDELHLYVSANLHEQQYQFIQCVNKDDKQTTELNDGDVLCSVSLNILAPKLTLKTAKELANLHDMYMPLKILLKNAQILPESHKCKTCPNKLSVLNLTILFLLLNINTHGIRKIKKNVLNITKSMH